jgi:hypothetical protein
MCLIFLIGTIFPQGANIEDYIKAGGKYVPLVRGMDFLDIFMSPLFLIVTFILLLNLIICLYDRLRLFLKVKRVPFDFERIRNHPNVITFKKTDFEKKLDMCGFRLKAESDNGSKSVVKVYEKGLQYWWLSWFYHVGIILAIIGFIITALFAFEQYFILYPGEPETISLYSKETRFNRILEKMGVEVPETKEGSQYTLKLKEFRTEYYQGLDIDYPRDKFDRLKLGLGIWKIEPSKKGFSYKPKMWLTSLDVVRPDGLELDASLWVNRPFRTGGLTLYQMAYQQHARLEVNGEVMEVEAREPFEIKELSGKFVIGSIRVGTLYKMDGLVEKITPHTTVHYIPVKPEGKKEILGEVKIGETLTSMGTKIKFIDYREGSYLSYRKDPGVWLVGFACLFVFLGLFVRTLGAWYRLQYGIEGNLAYVVISTRGILADRDRIMKKLQK